MKRRYENDKFLIDKESLSGDQRPDGVVDCRIKSRESIPNGQHIFVPGTLLNNFLLTPESLSKDYGKLQDEILEDPELSDWFGQIEINGFDGTDLTIGEYLALFGALEIHTRRSFEEKLPVVYKQELFDSGGVKKDSRGVYQSADILTLLEGYRGLSVCNRPIWIRRYRKDTGLFDITATWGAYLRIMPKYEGMTKKECENLIKRGLGVVALKNADSYRIELNPCFTYNWGEYYSRFPLNPARVVREYLHETGKQIKPYHFRFLAVLGQNRQRSNKIRLATLIERLGLERMRGKKGLSNTKDFIENELLGLAKFAGWLEAEPAISEARNGDVLYSFMLTQGLSHTQMERKNSAVRIGVFP